MKNYGTQMRGRFQFESNTEILNGTKTISIDDPQVQYLDANGSNRDVILPAEAISDGSIFFINNTTSASYNLVVKDDGGSTIDTLYQNELKWFACDGTTWKVGSSGSDDKEIQIDVFDVDGTMNAVEESNVWNMARVVRFSPLADGAVWCHFRLPRTFSISTDINFEISYCMSSSNTGDVSLNASFWVVEDGDIPDIASPDSGPLEDEIDPPNVASVYDILALTNIKLANDHLTNSTCTVIIKLWRDVDGCASNHNGWLEMTKLVAYQN